LLRRVRNESGYAHLKNKRYDRAVKALKMAVEHNPKDVAAWRHLASAYDGVGEPELARQARAKAEQLAEDQES
jgi:Flp pilus assembly protein TadD